MKSLSWGEGVEGFLHAESSAQERKISPHRSGSEWFKPLFSTTMVY